MLKRKESIVADKKEVLFSEIADDASPFGDEDLNSMSSPRRAPASPALINRGSIRAARDMMDPTREAREATPQMSARGKVIDTIHTGTEGEESGRDENGKALKLHMR